MIWVTHVHLLTHHTGQSCSMLQQERPEHGPSLQSAVILTGQTLNTLLFPVLQVPASQSLYVVQTSVPFEPFASSLALQGH